MMGKNCENLVSGIGSLIDSLTSAIIEISSGSTLRIQVNVVYDVGYEDESTGYIPTESIINAISKLKEDGDRLVELGNRLFVDTNKYNNSFGSPWGEMSNLYRMIDAIQSFISSSSELNYLGDRVAVLGLMNACLSLAIDAKYALLKNHDNIQQGYDKEYNNNESSIVKKVGLDTYGIGNLVQNFDENVCVKPTDPYASPF